MQVFISLCHLCLLFSGNHDFCIRGTPAQDGGKGEKEGEFARGFSIIPPPPRPPPQTPLVHRFLAGSCGGVPFPFRQLLARCEIAQQFVPFHQLGSTRGVLICQRASQTII